MEGVEVCPVLGTHEKERESERKREREGEREHSGARLGQDGVRQFER